MQKYNTISSFISDLEDLVSHLDDADNLNSIQSSTSIRGSELIDDISADEWQNITDIINVGSSLEDVHKQDMYLYSELHDLGYSDDEIVEILEFAEVYDNENN